MKAFLGNSSHVKIHIVATEVPYLIKIEQVLSLIVKHTKLQH